MSKTVFLEITYITNGCSLNWYPKEDKEYLSLEGSVDEQFNEALKQYINDSGGSLSACNVTAVDMYSCEGGSKWTADGGSKKKMVSANIRTGEVTYYGKIDQYGSEYPRIGGQNGN